MRSVVMIDAKWRNFIIWSTDGSGNYKSDTGVLSGNSVALKQVESTLHQDLNADGVIDVASAPQAGAVATNTLLSHRFEFAPLNIPEVVAQSSSFRELPQSTTIIIDSNGETQASEVHHPRIGDVAPNHHPDGFILV